MSTAASISVQQLADQDQREKLSIIDVRTPLEFREVHAASATNIPLDRLDPHAVMRQPSHTAEKPVYVICKSGQRAAKAQRQFLDAGYTNVVQVEGGTEAWVKAGLPVTRGKRAMSLERQVRIAAGSLVFIGAVLGYTVHPYFIGISAFVGAGLIFAGITDTCAMGMLIAKMPWNHWAEDHASCER